MSLIFGVEVTNTSERIWIILRSQWPSEPNRLIGSQPGAFVDLSIGSSGIVEVALRANHEVSHALVETIQTQEIDVATVHNVKSSRFQNQLIQDVDIVNAPSGDCDITRDAAAKIQQCMCFDRRFVFAKLCPGKKRETQIDSCRIESINRLVQTQPEILVLVEFSSSANQNLTQIGPNAPIAAFVRIGKCAARHLRPNSHMVEFGFHRAQTSFDIAEAFPISQLSESHAEELVQARKFLNLVIAMITIHALSKFVQRNKIQNLGEYSSSDVHRPLPPCYCNGQSVDKISNR